MMAIYFHAKKTVLTIAIMAAVTVAFYVLGIKAEENGFVENVQIGVLLAAFVCWVGEAIKANKLADAPHSPVFAAFFALVVYIVLGRELTWLKVIGVNSGVADLIELASIIIALVLLIGFLFFWIVRVSNRLKCLINYMSSLSFFYAVCSFVFVLVGDVFENNLLHVSRYQFFEEMAELTGYIFITLSAINFSKKINAAYERN
ncbi:hypothetical protein [Reinekea marinisedimentorum]|uniref:Uncharacterized protein n=1 Tax=Reinekea marinisedimentorum TaxID=230495 RepID=A0A4V2UJY5_9GAMM|nr:hypothetical protein [Reinekea marinisedimentorum]TCS41919.1 hypothetical protein BCF53_10423 [Reinekea marinisedimentorum]